MSDPATNKIPFFINQALHEVKDAALPDETDSAVVAKTKERIKEQIVDWGKDIAGDLFKATLHDFGVGEGVAAIGIGRLAGLALMGAKVVGDVAEVYHEQANQANAAAGLPEQTFLETLAIGYHLAKPLASSGVIDFTQTGRDARRDLTMLGTDIHVPDLSPQERAGNYLVAEETKYAKRLAEFNQNVQATEKIGSLVDHADNDFGTWRGRGAAAQEDYYAAFGRNFPDKDADLDARLKEVRSEVNRQRTVNQHDYQAVHKSGADFIHEGQQLFIQESLNDYERDLGRKRVGHQEDIPREQALKRMREQDAAPDLPAGQDILAEERGRSASNASQAAPDLCPCADILNQQLDEQTKIARALDEISRQGLHFVTGVGLEGL